MYVRLIKPDWGKPYLKPNEQNPNFVREIKGPNTLEGMFDQEFITQKNHEGYNSYWFPNHPSKDVYTLDSVKHLSGRHIDQFNYVFIDMDLKDGIYKDLEDFLDVVVKFPIKPSLTVCSGNGVHVYWKIKNLTREMYCITQMALINKFKTDESVWTVLQLMRIPGSKNTKDSLNFKDVQVVDGLSTSIEYQIEDFPKDIYLIPEDKALKITNHLAKLDGRAKVNLQENVNIDEVPDSFIDLMYDNESIYQLFNNPIEAYGDRSGADMKLSNIMFSKGICKKDALAVIANTQKGLSKGANRFDYALMTVDKAYVDRTKNKFKTVGERLKSGIKDVAGIPINGPYFFDTNVLQKCWKKKQILGIIAGSGVGKTAITLMIIKAIIENNPDNDDVFVFLTLEMPESEIIDRWIDLVGADSPLADRLYVIGTEDEVGEPRVIGLQEIYEFCDDIRKVTGKQIGSLAIDHFGLISGHINMKKKYTFGIMGEQNSGFGDIRKLSPNKKATEIKTLAKLLNTFPIVLTQTTKEKGVGDLPIGKDGAYGISEYENIMDYIITAWQPLMRVKHLCDTQFLAFQYAKLRHQHKLDKIKIYQPKLLVYDMDTGDLIPPTPEEFSKFNELLPKAEEARKLIADKKTSDYSKVLSVMDTKMLHEKLAQIQGLKNVE